MSEIRRALKLARNILWELLVMKERGEVTMPEEMRKQIDMAEQICGEALDTTPDVDSN